MNKNLVAVAVGAALAAAGASAHAVDAKLSGHLNRAIMYADDGDHTETHYVDNCLSNSRFRFTGTEDIGGGIKAGINWEMQFVSNNSCSVTQVDNPATTATEGRSPGSALGERFQDVYFTGAFGTVTVGQGAGAADGATETDLSGTGYVVTGALSYLLGNAITYRVTGDKSLAGGGPSIGSTVNNFDFLSRYDRMRYDSPKLGPVSLAVSRGVIGDADANEVAVRVNTDMGGAGKLAASVGYSDLDVDSPADNTTTLGGSISWLAPFGFNVTAGYSNRENDHPTAPVDAKWTFLQLGYKTGIHAVSVMYAKGDDQAANGDEADAIGAGYVINPTKTVQIYAGLHRYSLDRAATDFESVTVGTVGSRIFF